MYTFECLESILIVCLFLVYCLSLLLIKIAYEYIINGGLLFFLSLSVWYHVDDIYILFHPIPRLLLHLSILAETNIIKKKQGIAWFITYAIFACQ